MTETELAGASEKLGQIRNIRELLKRARLTLDFVNQYGKAGQVWKPTLKLSEEDRWGNGGIKIEVEVPFGVIQQQAVYAVAKLERMLIRAGGSLS